jgi:hypothetical protein
MNEATTATADLSAVYRPRPRIKATRDQVRLAVEAIEALLNGECMRVIAYRDGRLVRIDQCANRRTDAA